MFSSSQRAQIQEKIEKIQGCKANAVRGKNEISQELISHVVDRSER
jgi:hypothetical protein